MKARLLSLAVLGAFTIGAGSAMAAPVKLSKAQLDQVVAGKITEHKYNPAGNEVSPNSNGKPHQTVNENPAGKAPPGQN